MGWAWGSCSCFCSFTSLLTHSFSRHTADGALAPLILMRTSVGACGVGRGLDLPRSSEAGLQQTFLGHPGQVHRPDARGHP